jgi:hypothetical protein
MAPRRLLQPLRDVRTARSSIQHLPGRVEYLLRPLVPELAPDLGANAS